jgi:molybdopterin-binding protein
MLFSLGADDVLIAIDRPTRLSARNILRAQVQTITEVENGTSRVDLGFRPGGQQLSAAVTDASLREMQLRQGDAVFVVFKTTACVVLA